MNQTWWLVKTPKSSFSVDCWSQPYGQMYSSRPSRLLPNYISLILIRQFTYFMNIVYTQPASLILHEISRLAYKN